MGKSKPFIDKKKGASTFHLLHRSQRDIAGDGFFVHNDHQEQQEGDVALGGMILWPATGNNPIMNQIVLQAPARNKPGSTSSGVEQGVAGVAKEGESGEEATANQPQGDIMSMWRAKLASVGLLEDNPIKYLKPISGQGVFLDSSGRVVRNAAATVAAVDTDNRPSWSEEDLLLEVGTGEKQQFDSIALVSDYMDEDIAAILHGDFDDGEYEELNDDVFDAAKEEEEIVVVSPSMEQDVQQQGHDDQEHQNHRDNNGVNEDHKLLFDYDEHIRKLMEKAQHDREVGRGDLIPNNHTWAKKDNEFFSQLKPHHEFGHDDDHDEEDGWDDDNSRDLVSTSNDVVPALTTEEERALCEMFMTTLAEYDSDEMGDCPDEDIQGSRPIEGDAQMEAVMDEFLLERDSEVYMKGHLNGNEEMRTGGSGYNALVGKKMVNSKQLESLEMPYEEPKRVEEILAEAQETLARDPVHVPPEEIFIDGKSYFSEKERNPFDCESILSTYSNLANNPTTIEPSRRFTKKKNNSNKKKVGIDPDNDSVHQIKLSDKTGLPLGVIPSRHVSTGASVSDTLASVNRGEARSKEESKEVKKARKEAVKKERQFARIQKKVVREVYEGEIQRISVDVGGDDLAGRTVFRYS